jgi:hypothetical protein
VQRRRVAVEIEAGADVSAAGAKAVAALAPSGARAHRGGAARLSRAQTPLCSVEEGALHDNGGADTGMAFSLN